MFMPSLAKTGKGEVAKTIRGIPDKNLVFSAAGSDHWSDSSKNSTGSLSLDPRPSQARYHRGV